MTHFHFLYPRLALKDALFPVQESIDFQHICSRGCEERERERARREEEEKIRGERYSASPTLASRLKRKRGPGGIVTDEQLSSRLCSPKAIIN